MKIIARIRSDFPTKFGIPRQSGRVEELTARVVFEPEYRVREAVKGMEDFSHIWLLWEFSQAIRENWSPRYVHRVWVEMKEWAYLLPDPPSVQIR